MFVQIPDFLINIHFNSHLLPPLYSHIHSLQTIQVFIEGGSLFYWRLTHYRITFIVAFIATASNNGIGYFVGNKNNTQDEGGISVNRNGSVGYAFYHPYSALYGNDTRKLIPEIKDKYISLFITRAIVNQKDKYGYGYKMGTGRLKRQKIMLPINLEGDIDYGFMKKYMIIQEIKEIYKVIDYYKKH